MPNNFNKDIQDLLDIAEADTGDEVITKPEKDTDVEKFIKKFNVQDGNSFVPVIVIYYTYCLWRPQDRMSKIAFFKRFSKIYDAKIIKAVKGYLLNNELGFFDLSVENYFAARNFVRRSKRMKEIVKKRKGKKKQS